jgi:UPF0042 nucleotide-binding protein
VSFSSLILVTGMSGAGKTTVLHTLEDCGFETIDNIPLSLIAPLAVRIPTDDEVRGLAIGVDIRTRYFDAEDCLKTLDELRLLGSDVQLVFLESDDVVLQRRFTETRRKHPLKTQDLMQSIQEERLLLALLKEKADWIIDTSEMNSTYLKTYIQRILCTKSEHLVIQFLSFSYRDGLPRDADMVFDMRFLRNPHYEDDLRAKTGLDLRVADYVTEDVHYSVFYKQSIDMITQLIPRYQQAGKSYLTIAFGCTGGKHRSVCMVDAIYRFMCAQHIECSVRHLALER